MQLVNLEYQNWHISFLFAPALHLICIFPQAFLESWFFACFLRLGLLVFNAFCWHFCVCVCVSYVCMFLLHFLGPRFFVALLFPIACLCTFWACFSSFGISRISWISWILPQNSSPLELCGPFPQDCDGILAHPIPDFCLHNAEAVIDHLKKGIISECSRVVQLLAPWIESREGLKFHNLQSWGFLPPGRD